MKASKATIYTPEINHNGHTCRLAVLTCPDSGDQYLEIQSKIDQDLSSNYKGCAGWNDTWSRRPGLNCNVLEATILAMLGK